MNTGKAYAYLDYERTWQELVVLMEINKQRANFTDPLKFTPDTLEFTVLDDKISPFPIRERLPAEIADAAKFTDVYGSVSIDKVADLPKKPKRASDLRYIVMAQDPEVSDSESAEPLGQGRANQVTAGMLKEVLILLGERERNAGHSKFLRAVVFYLDDRNRVQRYL